MKSSLHSLTTFLPFLLDYSANCQLRNSTDSNDLLCPFYKPSARTAQRTALLLLRVLVYAETRLLNCSIATAVRVTSRIIKVPLLLRAGIT
jgi:hypothetical protein